MRNFSFGIITAFISAGITSAAFVFAAAGIGWLMHSQVVAAALAMIVSSVMIFGFGDLPSWAKIVVGLLWWFSDVLLAKLGLYGWSAYLTMAGAYFLMGLTKGKPAAEVLMNGFPVMVGTVIGVTAFAIIKPKSMAGTIEETIISTIIISAVRSAKQFKNLLAIRRYKQIP
jgi:hypothetical protein